MNGRAPGLPKKVYTASKDSLTDLRQSTEGGFEEDQAPGTVGFPAKKVISSPAQGALMKNNSAVQLHGVLAKHRPLTSSTQKSALIPFYMRSSKRPSSSSASSIESVALIDSFKTRDVNKERGVEVHQLTKNLRYTECSTISKKHNKLFRQNMVKMNLREEMEDGVDDQSAQIALQKLLRKIENTEFSSLIPKVRLTTDFGALFDDLVRLKEMKEVDSDPTPEVQVNGLNSIEVKKNQSKEFTVSKTSYNYFFINCHLETSPLRLIIRQNEEIYEKGMFRGFISSTHDLPTKNNCDRYFEGSSFKFYSPDRKPCFSVHRIYVSVIAGNNEKVKLKAKFGEPEKKITKESMDLFKRKKELADSMQNMSEEHLQAALKEIYRKRREQKIRLGIGNYIEKNKFVERFSVERRTSDILLRGQIQDFRIKKAKERKTFVRTEEKQKKIFLSQKHELVKNVKSALEDIKGEKNKIKKRDKVWVDFFCLIKVLEVLYLRIKEKFKERDRKRNIASMIVNKQISFKQSLKSKGTDSKTWILNDVKQGLSFKLPFFIEKINKNAEHILVDFLKKTIVNFVIHEKCKQFIDQVLKFKLRWKLYKTKRAALKKNLKILWENLYPDMLDRIYGQELKAQKKPDSDNVISEEKEKDQKKAIKKLISYKDAQMHAMQKELFIEETLSKIIASSKQRFSVFVFKVKQVAAKEGKPFRLVDLMKKIPRINQLENANQIKAQQGQDKLTRITKSVDELRYPILFEMPSEEEISEKMYQVLLKVSKPAQKN